MHVIAGKAVAFKEAMEPAFRDYQKQTLANAAAAAKRWRQKDCALFPAALNRTCFL